jgi:transposase
MTTTEPWASVEDVAKHLGVAKDSVYRWIGREAPRKTTEEASRASDDGGNADHERTTTRADECAA